MQDTRPARRFLRAAGTPWVSRRSRAVLMLYQYERSSLLIAIRRVAALLYATVSAGVVAFQLALAAGAPWGEYAMGGVIPGQFPPALRIAALVQAALLVGMAAVVMARAGIVLPGWSRVSRRLVWAVVAFAAVSLVLNLITPSARERAIWAPVALLLLISSAVVAIQGSLNRPAK